MKLSPILIVISLCVSFLFGQNKQTIIQSCDYFYGSGTSLDSREARDPGTGGTHRADCRAHGRII